MATVTKGRTFTSGETVTPAKLNDVVDLATVTDIQTADIADNQVTVSKLAATLDLSTKTVTLPDANVTVSKLAATLDLSTKTVTLPDANVTTAKILDANVTNAKLATDIDASKLTTGTIPADRIGSDAITPAKLSQPLTRLTAIASISDTSINFTDIPSWVRRITLMLNRVSTNETTEVIVRIGDAGGIETTGYVASASYISKTAGVCQALSLSAGYGVTVLATAAVEVSGVATLVNLAENIWCYQFGGAYTSRDGAFGGGVKTLSNTLDRVSLTTLSGTATFDSGTVNIIYEG